MAYLWLAILLHFSRRSVVPKVTIKSAKKRAWTVFSEYIRKKYADKDGWVECITCGKRMRWNQSQAGHAMAGRYNSILFEEKLVRPQGKCCNIFKGGAPDEYHAWMLKEYGQDGYEELLRQKHSSRKFTVAELEDMIAEWREDIKQFEKEKAL